MRHRARTQWISRYHCARRACLEDWLAWKRDGAIGETEAPCLRGTAPRNTSGEAIGKRKSPRRTTRRARRVLRALHGRYILVLTRTHGQLRRAVRILNRTLAELKLAKHPDKTF